MNAAVFWSAQNVSGEDRTSVKRLSGIKQHWCRIKWIQCPSVLLALVGAVMASSILDSKYILSQRAFRRE